MTEVKTGEAERVRASAVARMTSLSIRKVQGMAAVGKVPGAAKLGGVWTFDPARIRAWIREQELACLARQRISTPRGAVRSRDIFSMPDASIDEAYERFLSGKGRKSKQSTAR